MLIDAMRCRSLILSTCLLQLLAPISLAQDEGQYRSRLLLDPQGAINTGSELSIEALEQQIDAIADPYARSSAGRHLARHHVQEKAYDQAIAYYQDALASGGLSDIANREMQRELAQVYLLSENYTAAIATLENVLNSTLAPDIGDYLLLAQSHYRSGNYVAVVAALDRAQARGLSLNALQLRQALALYYRAGAFAQCEQLLRELLTLEPEEPQHWHQLASVYLQQDKKRQALDQLMLAWEKLVPFTEPQTLLLVDLQAATGNPYGAAEILDQALARQTLAASAANYRKLFELWLQAREREQAAAALARAAGLSGDTELYLYLAQLQMEQEDWQAMQQTLLVSCANQLQDQYVSRANLLLGISQLKLGDRQGARRYLINATLVGGAHAQAAQWLEYMEAGPTTPDEARRVVGPCYGSSGKQADLVVSSPQPVAAAVAQERPQQPTFQFKTIPAMRLFYRTYHKTLAELASSLQGQALQLGVALVKAGGTVDGPLHLIANTAGEGVQLAFPSRGSPQARGRNKTRRSAAFKCAYLVVEAPAAELRQTLIDFARALRAAGHEFSGESRVVFTDSGGGSQDRLRVELQLGIR